MEVWIAGVWAVTTTSPTVLSDGFAGALAAGAGCARAAVGAASANRIRQVRKADIPSDTGAAGRCGSDVVIQVYFGRKYTCIIRNAAKLGGRGYGDRMKIG